MARNGFFTKNTEWAKHLRPDGKKFFHKAERQAERKFISDLPINDYHVDGWYEGSPDEEKLDAYWTVQWQLDEKSNIIKREHSSVG